MKRKEIVSKFDMIVDFSGTERFLDTPLKHFSSGMQLRLAFSVAAFLEPEILVIDEVLAVGDAEFQKKCMGKMEEVGKEGRTILFVSHNLNAITALCSRVIVIKSGSVLVDDESTKAINEYYKQEIKQGLQTLDVRKDRNGTGEFIFSSVRFLGKVNNEVSVFKTGEEIKIEVKLSAKDKMIKEDVYVTLAVKDSSGQRILGLASGYYRQEIKVKDGTLITWTWKRCQLVPGDYFCDLVMYKGFANGVVIDNVTDAFPLYIEDNDYFGAGVHIPVKRDKIYTDFEVTSSI
jgi:lipopolysaccharide transport system ATP-binding protein